MKLIFIFFGLILGTVNIENDNYIYDEQGRPIPPSQNELNILPFPNK